MEESNEYKKFKEEGYEKIKSKKAVDEEELQNFIQRVDKVETILRKMNSNDEESVKLGINQADEILGKNMEGIIIDENNIKIKQDRSLINKDAYKENNEETMEMDAFKRSVEIDAKRRSDDRRQRKEVAERYKNEGNKAFRLGNYNKALDLYNKALDEVKDSCLLYTNRALTLLRLGLPQRVLEDTEKALRINEFSLKALLYRSQALHELERDEEAKKVILEALEKQPKQKKYILEYASDWYEEDQEEEVIS